MTEEIIIEGDEAPAPAPVIVTVITPESDSGSSDADLAELEELRAFKAKVDEERMAEAERVAAEALATAALAAELATMEPEEPEVIEEPKPDVAPDKSHPWFKQL